MRGPSTVCIGKKEVDRVELSRPPLPTSRGHTSTGCTVFVSALKNNREICQSDNILRTNIYAKIRFPSMCFN